MWWDLLKSCRVLIMVPDQASRLRTVLELWHVYIVSHSSWTLMSCEYREQSFMNMINHQKTLFTNNRTPCVWAGMADHESLWIIMDRHGQSYLFMSLDAWWNTMNHHAPSLRNNHLWYLMMHMNCSQLIIYLLWTYHVWSQAEFTNYNSLPLNGCMIGDGEFIVIMFIHNHQQCRWYCRWLMMDDDC